MPDAAMMMKKMLPSVWSSETTCYVGVLNSNARTGRVDEVWNALQRHEEGHGQQEEAVEETAKQFSAAPAIGQRVRVTTAPQTGVSMKQATQKAPTSSSCAQPRRTLLDCNFVMCCV